MFKQIQKTIGILSLIMFAGAMIAASSAFAEDEAPPTLNIQIPAPTPEGDTPPTLNIQVPTLPPDNPVPPVDPKKEEPEKINITNDKADPKKFNPAIDETEISYTIFSSYGAKIEVKILDEDNEKVVTLVDKKQDAGKQIIVWYGTKDNKEDGELVDAGTYTYKIIAKNPTTSDTEDTAEGKIEVFISNVINDDSEEEELASDNGSGQSSAGNAQADATMTLNNTDTGEVADTGPEVLFYALLPLISLVAINRFKK